MTAVHVNVSGRVQGVAFRAWLSDEAREARVDGWVRNRQDGRVEAVLAGDNLAVEGLLSRLWQGPPAARVTDVDVDEWTGEVPEGFTVLRTG